MKQLIFVLICSFLIGCSKGKKTSGIESNQNPVNVDSLNAVFIAGWNKKDSAAIMNTLSDNAIVMNDSLVHKGKQEIASKWVSGGVKALSNVRTVSMVKNGNNNIAYDGGTYSLDITLPNVTLKERGIYTLVWEKQKESWKLTLVHIEDITRMPDIK